MKLLERFRKISRDYSQDSESCASNASIVPGLRRVLPASSMRCAEHIEGKAGEQAPPSCCVPMAKWHVEGVCSGMIFMQGRTLCRIF